MNSTDKLRFAKSISRAIKTLEQDAKCFCYSDEPEFLELIESMKTHRPKVWLVDADNMAPEQIRKALKDGYDDMRAGNVHDIDVLRTWDDLEKEIFTPEEIAESDKRVAEIGKKLRARHNKEVDWGKPVGAEFGADDDIGFDYSEDEDDEELIAMAEERQKKAIERGEVLPELTEEERTKAAKSLFGILPNNERTDD